ncbi:MAG: GAF domain-containing protein [Chloroflexi bacterium]|nr:GAF domain-containing protein [Chloroflexota bacterium]
MGGFSAAIGALMLVAPHQFEAPHYAAFQPYLPWWGAAFLLAGVGLLCVSVLAPQRTLEVTAHLFAGAVQGVLAYGFLATGTWTGASTHLVLGLGTALAPFLPRSRLDRPGAGGDLFALLMGAGTALSGLVILTLPEQLSASVYDLARPYLPWFGVAYLGTGLGLVAAHLHPSPPRVAFWAAHLLLASALFAFLVAVPLPSRAWIGITSHGGFGTVLLLLPWLRSRLRFVDLSSLKTRLALALAVAVALPLIVGVALGEGQAERSITAETLSVQQGMATVLAQSVADYVAFHRAAVAALAAQPGLLDLAPDAQRARLGAVHRAYPAFVVLSTFDADGRPFVRSDDRPLISGAEFRAFQDARRTGEPALDILIGPLIGRPVFAFGAPAHAPDGRFAGLVAGVLESERLVDLLTAGSDREDMRLYLVDASGRVIAHPEAGLVASFADLAAAPPVAALLAGPGRAGALAYGGQAGAWLAGYARVPGLGWGVVAEQPAAAALASSRAQRDLHFGLLLLAMVVAAAFGVVAAGWLVAPLRSLARAAGDLAADYRITPLPKSHVTEIAYLSTAFSEMRDRLAARTAERERAEQEVRARARTLTALHEVAVATSGVLAPATLAGLVVDYARDLLGADSAGLFWWDAEAGILRPLGENDPGLAALDRKLRPGQGVSGVAFQRAEPVVVEDYAAWEHATSWGVAGGIRSTVAVPLLVSDRALGALGVRSGVPRRFEPEQVQLLALFAAQAGPALEAARLHAESERRRAEAEAAQRRLAFLAEASNAVTGSLDYEATLATVARLAVPSLADYCMVDLVRADGSLGLVAVAHANPAREELLRELRRCYPPDSNGPHPVARVLRTGQPELIPEFSDPLLETIAQDAEHLRLAQELGSKSFLVAPLVTRGRTLGVISFASDSHRRYGPADLALAEDLAHRCALAIDNARLYQEVQQALRTRDEFLAAVTHDLKNPLTIIKGHVQLLQRRAGRASMEGLADGLGKIDAGARKMTALINELLDVASQQTGRPLALDRRPTDLVALVRQAVAEHQQVTQRHRLRVETTVAEATGLWDAARLERVLGNLLSNAIKYSPEGGEIAVRIAREEAGSVEEGKAEAWALVAVRDQGLGIPRADLDRVFERFQRGGNVAGRIPGTGLGLAGVRQIVEQHGGCIGVESQEGVGSTFTLRLPLADDLGRAGG